MERENFYILLELSIDPPETSLQEIEAAISRKQSEWSRLRNHPTRGLQAQKYISLIPLIRQVMTDPASREQELLEAKKQAFKGREAKLAEIDSHVDILMGKGYISKEEIVKLASRHEIAENEIQDRIRLKKEEKFAKVDQQLSLRMAKGYITEEEINKLAARHNLKPEEVKSRVYMPMLKNEQEIKETPPPRQLDRSIEKTIRDNLKIVDKTSLYHFLGLRESADLETLQATAIDKKKQLATLGRKDAVVTAGNTLAGHCANIFKNEETRIAYDISLARQRLAELDSDIDISCFNDTIRLEYCEILVRKAIDFGMEKLEAERYIKDYCKRKNWSVEEPSGRNRKTMLIIGLTLGFFLIAVIVIGFFSVRHNHDRQIEKSHASFIARVEQETDLQKRVSLLGQYIGRHGSDRGYAGYVEDARNRMNTYQTQYFDRIYAELKKKVDSRIASGDFEGAKSTINNYIGTRPPSSHAARAQQELDKIEAVEEKHYFEKLSETIIEAGVDDKIAAIETYLERFPKGKNLDAVQRMLASMSTEYYIFVNNAIAMAEARNDWNVCAELAQSYIRLFDNSNTDKLKIRLEGFNRQIHQQRVLASLKRQAGEFNHDYTQAVQVFTNYLAAYPETPLENDIKKEIEALSELHRKQEMQNARNGMLDMLSELGGRFTETTTGVVKDRETGLMWTLLDSRVVRSSECITYESAEKHIENLTTGGYSDWRLPTASELVQIYKKEPAFPVSGQGRYWSSNSYTGYSSGWYRIVDVIEVHPDRHASELRIDSRECGSVRAVRNE